MWAEAESWTLPSCLGRTKAKVRQEGRPNLEGRRMPRRAGLCLGFDRGLSDARLGSERSGPNQGMVRLEVCLPGRMVRLCVCASAEPLGRFGAALSCRCPRMAHGWSEAGADLRPMSPRISGKILLIMSSRPSRAGSPEQCSAYLRAASYLAAGHYSRVFRRGPSDKMELRVGAPPGLAVCCLGCVRILCAWAPLYIR